MKFVVGHHVTTNAGNEGYVVESRLCGDETRYHVYFVSDELMDQWFPESELMERPPIRRFFIGDEVAYLHDGNMETTGIIYAIPNDEHYNIRWKSLYGCTHELGRNLRLIRRSDVAARKPRIPNPDFVVGDRVFYARNVPARYALGVVSKIDYVTAFDGVFYTTGDYKVSVTWDNGVESIHDPIEVGRTNDAIKALEAPIP